MLVPSTPMKEDRLTTSGSFRIASASACWRSRHGGEGDRLRASVIPWISAGVLHREEALGDRRRRARRSAPACRPRPAASAAGGRAPSRARGRSGRSAASNQRSRAPVERRSRLRPVAAAARAHSIGTRVSDTTAEIRMVTARVIGEFAEQPADHVAHEQQRDQHRDQRDGQRDDGEADLLRRPSAPPPAATRPAST